MVKMKNGNLKIHPYLFFWNVRFQNSCTKKAWTLKKYTVKRFKMQKKAWGCICFIFCIRFILITFLISIMLSSFPVKPGLPKSICRILSSVFRFWIPFFVENELSLISIDYRLGHSLCRIGLTILFPPFPFSIFPKRNQKSQHDKASAHAKY